MAIFSPGASSAPTLDLGMIKQVFYHCAANPKKEQLDASKFFIFQKSVNFISI
jgi:hypothetical protein